MKVCEGKGASGYSQLMWAAGGCNEAENVSVPGDGISEFPLARTDEQHKDICRYRHI